VLYPTLPSRQVAFRFSGFELGCGLEASQIDSSKALAELCGKVGKSEQGSCCRTIFTYDKSSTHFLSFVSCFPISQNHPHTTQILFNMSITIRPIQSSDEPTWRTHWAAYNEFYQRVDRITESITATTFSRFLDKNISVKCAVAADSEGDLVGFVTWYPHPSTDSIEDVVYLNDLFVDPQARNGGVGRKLIEHVYSEADKAGTGKVYWHTQYFNHRAQLLYTKVAKRTDFVMYSR